MDLSSNVSHFFLGSLLLSLETLLGLKGHADLGKFEDEFEVRIDRVEGGGLIGLTYGFQKLALNALKIHVDRTGNVSNPLFLEG